MRRIFIFQSSVRLILQATMLAKTIPLAFLFITLSTAVQGDKFDLEGYYLLNFYKEGHQLLGTSAHSSANGNRTTTRVASN